MEKFFWEKKEICFIDGLAILIFLKRNPWMLLSMTFYIACQDAISRTVGAKVIRWKFHLQII